MSSRFVDLELAVDFLGHNWTVEKVIEKIKQHEITAYARITCLHNHSSVSASFNDVEDSKQYEIARIKSLNPNPQNWWFEMA